MRELGRISEPLEFELTIGICCCLVYPCASARNVIIFSSDAVKLIPEISPLLREGLKAHDEEASEDANKRARNCRDRRVEGVCGGRRVRQHES